MLKPPAFYTGRRSAAVAPSPPAATTPASNPHHAVELSQVPRAWPSAAEMSASNRDGESRPESAGGRCLNERTCTWAVCGFITGGIFCGAAGVAAVLLARASGDHTTFDLAQGGALGAMAGAVLGGVAGCLLNACCVDPAQD